MLISLIWVQNSPRLPVPKIPQYVCVPGERLTLADASTLGVIYCIKHCRCWNSKISLKVFGIYIPKPVSLEMSFLVGVQAYMRSEIFIYNKNKTTLPFFSMRFEAQ